MNVPDWYILLLLAGASFRTWRLLSEDDILDRPRRYITRLGDKWEKEGDPVPSDYRIRLAAFLSCPWCLGFWSAIGWWYMWQIFPHEVEVAAVPLAISVFVPLLEKVTTDS